MNKLFWLPVVILAPLFLLALLNSNARSRAVKLMSLLIDKAKGRDVELKQEISNLVNEAKDQTDLAKALEKKRLETEIDENWHKKL